MKNKINTRAIFALLILILAWQGSIAQQRQAAMLEDITTDNAKTSWIHFKHEARINPNTVFEIYRNNFGLNEKDEMKNFRTNEVAMTGITIKRYQQYHNGIKVLGASMNVYEHEGVALKANGKLVKDPGNVIEPIVTENDALQKALSIIPAKDYGWLDQRKVEKIRLKKKDASYSLYPKGELVYAQPKGKADFKGEDFILCWKFDVAMSKSNSQRVIINAATGEIVNNYSLDANCNGTTIDLPYNGPQTVYTSQQNRCSSGNYYEMWDDCNAAYIHVEDYDTNDPKCNYTSGNTWTGLTGTTSDAAQVNWGMRQTFQYYVSHFGWNSYDNSSGSIDCTVGFNFIDDNGNTSGNNARYTPFDEDFDFGYGDGLVNDSDSYTTLDIVAHEFTHGVTNFSSDLDYSDESGALNESFSDIFGEIVEMAVENNWTTPTWLHAEDRTNVNYHRSFINPNAKDNPDTYTGSYWYSGSDDNGGVHTNSSVQNHFFYLLVEGGTGVNDLQNNYHVNGIGINDAIEIAWSGLMYVNSSANYVDARDAWIEAAIDLFGSCSNQAIQVGNAWHAVGVGSQSPYYIKSLTGTLTAATSNKTYEAIDQVLTFGPTNVNSVSGTKEVRFYAGNEITLNLGFTAPSGCAFKAKINPCSITLHSAPRDANNNSNEIGSKVIEIISTITVSPNPFTNGFVCRFNNADDETEGSLSIFDAMGKLVFKTEKQIVTGHNELNIDAADLKPGLYHLSLNTKSGKSYSQKIVKQ
ncbi:MAG: M4 family metallopeptidase [Bacteroidia bacterium]